MRLWERYVASSDEDDADTSDTDSEADSFAAGRSAMKSNTAQFARKSAMLQATRKRTAQRKQQKLENIGKLTRPSGQPLTTRVLSCQEAFPRRASM